MASVTYVCSYYMAGKQQSIQSPDLKSFETMVEAHRKAFPNMKNYFSAIVVR